MSCIARSGALASLHKRATIGRWNGVRPDRWGIGSLERVHPGLRGVARARAVAATFDSYGRYFYELFRLPHESPDWVQAHFSGHGTEHGIRDARARV